MPEHAKLSILDFCTIYEGETASQSMARSVELAQEAEKLGYSRIWYTEHHNMPNITSSSPAVLISHIGAKTNTIRLGAGGVMLPNHSPYVIAEQFGTLAELYPIASTWASAVRPAPTCTPSAAPCAAMPTPLSASRKTSASCKVTSPASPSSQASRPSPE